MSLGDCSQELPDGFRVEAGPYEVEVCGIYYRTQQKIHGHFELTPVASEVRFRDTRNNRVESFRTLNLEGVVRGAIGYRNVAFRLIAFRLNLSQGAKYGADARSDFLTLDKDSMCAALRRIAEKASPYYEYVEAMNKEGILVIRLHKS